MNVLERSGGLGLVLPSEENVRVESINQLPKGEFTFYRIVFTGPKVEAHGDSLFDGLNFESDFIMSVTSSTLTDAGLKKLSASPRQLSIAALKVTEVGLAHLQNLKGTKLLILGKMPSVSGTGLLKLSDSIENLVVQFPITPAGLVAIFQNPRLKSLHTDVTLTPTHLQAFETCRLEELRFGGVHWNDELMPHLPAMPALKRVYLRAGASITVVAEVVRLRTELSRVRLLQTVIDAAHRIRRNALASGSRDD